MSYAGAERVCAGVVTGAVRRARLLAVGDTDGAEDIAADRRLADRVAGVGRELVGVKRWGRRDGRASSSGGSREELDRQHQRPSFRRQGSSPVLGI